MLTITAIEIRLFMRPIVIGAISPLMYLALAYWIPKQFGDSIILKPLAEMAQGSAGTVALVIFTGATLLFSHSVYQYWLWINQHIPSCPSCGMMMQQRTGRYGSFWGCMCYPNCRGTLDF